MNQNQQQPTPAQGMALWNPNAAAAWSILFTPLFGAYLHTLNWRALGNSEQERASMRWVVAGVLVLASFVIIDATAFDHAKGDALARSIEFVFFLAWYFLSARGQAKTIRAQYGAHYRRMSWRKPLLVALGCFCAYVLLVVAIASVIGLRSFL